jgi:hypothetical protein
MEDNNIKPIIGKMERFSTKFRQLKYLVTGTGRCGTVWFARMLTHNGIPCGHESLFDIGGLHSALGKIKNNRASMSIVSSHRMDENSDWYTLPQWWDTEGGLVADSSFMAAPYLSNNLFKDVKKINLVRNPFKVVNSFVSKLNFFKNPCSNLEWEWFIYENLKCLKNSNLNQIDRACLFYLEWIGLINSCEDVFVHRLEDGLTKELSNFLGTELENPVDFVGGNNDTFKSSDVRFMYIEQITSKEIKERFVEVVESYGYNVQCNMIL